MLCSQIIALRSDIWVNSIRGWLGGANHNLEGPSSQPMGWIVSPGDRSIMLKALAAGMRGLGGGQRIEAVAVGRDKWG